MARVIPFRPVSLGFEGDPQQVEIADIRPLRLVSSTTKLTSKYRQIASSIREIGLVELPVIARDRSDPGKYLLLDGHLRMEVLKDLGETHVVCLVSTDDEAFTYNRRLSRLAIVQEHKMILNAVERGVPEERIAKVLNLDVETIRQKRRLLDGICPEVAELLKEKQMTASVFLALKKMTSIRQIEAAHLMIAMNKYTASYARSLLAATPPEQLFQPKERRQLKGLSDDQISLMRRESESLQREFKLAEQSYGDDHLDLVLAKGYLASLLGNARIVRYLDQTQSEILREFQKIADTEATAA